VAQATVAHHSYTANVTLPAERKQESNYYCGQHPWSVRAASIQTNKQTNRKKAQTETPKQSIKTQPHSGIEFMQPTPR
jgi:hypothetical protein